MNEAIARDEGRAVALHARALNDLARARRCLLLTPAPIDCYLTPWHAIKAALDAIEELRAMDKQDEIETKEGTNQ